jgi:hypothetical protein
MFVCCKCCVYCQVEVSATGWSLVQRSPTNSGVSFVCDHVTSVMRRLKLVRIVNARQKKKKKKKKFPTCSSDFICHFVFQLAEYLIHCPIRNVKEIPDFLLPFWRRDFYFPSDYNSSPETRFWCLQLSSVFFFFFSRRAYKTDTQ